MASTSLTDHLTNLSTRTPYAAAIAHPFLTSAGQGTLSHSLLALWLSQDRIYAAHAYPRFIGLLIAHIPFSSSHALDSDEERKNKRALKVLTSCLENVVKEVNFFGEIAQKWGLQLEGWQERKGTRDYTAEMARVAGNSFEDGLVFLWAMEKVYLDAWTNVRFHVSRLPPSASPTTFAVGSFSANWSSPEFVTFVGDLADLVNDLGFEPESEGWKRAEEIWERVIELEERFWPVEEEEVFMRIQSP